MVITSIFLVQASLDGNHSIHGPLSLSSKIHEAQNEAYLQNKIMWSPTPQRNYFHSKVVKIWVAWLMLGKNWLTLGDGVLTPAVSGRTEFPPLLRGQATSYCIFARSDVWFLHSLQSYQQFQGSKCPWSMNSTNVSSKHILLLRVKRWYQRWARIAIKVDSSLSIQIIGPTYCSNVTENLFLESQVQDHKLRISICVLWSINELSVPKY
jgi:hypothetical protein